MVNGKYIFEVGGKNKTTAQIKEQQEAFLALDDITYGSANRIPLWLFGFLYYYCFSRILQPVFPTRGSFYRKTYLNYFPLRK